MARKIIHIDMDCFYAAIEVRDDPSLKGKPVGVGGSSGRGVLTTANYEARKYGCRSAMPVFMARQLCPDIILTPVRFDVYREASQMIRAIFGRYADLIQPLSLDEAYLDVSHRAESGAALAQEIRQAIFQETGLTASAGIAPNKMIAKVASDWNKPDGQLEVKSEEVDGFMRGLRVAKLQGVGKRGQETLLKMGIETCGDLQVFSKFELADQLGRWGLELYERCRGRDDREVSVARTRKSLSKERTFRENIDAVDWLLNVLRKLRAEVAEAVERKSEQEIKSRVVKLKFEDFTQTTAEKAGGAMDEEIYEELLRLAWSRGEGKSVRLLGVGVKFATDEDQMDLL
ncbi:MAG: DNA polymerase IV [Akkermansiaceae bacterium]|nr:DNA polymerase IV [Akkermansiaceae bacterium]